MSDSGSDGRTSRGARRERTATDEDVRPTHRDANNSRRDSDREGDNDKNLPRKRYDSQGDSDREVESSRRPTNQLIENRTAKALDEPSRHARWLSLLKNKLSFGFHHLSPAHLPSMSEEKRAFALCFEKVTNWPLPESVLKAFGKGEYEIILQLSLSLYHLDSASFFGSTWMGPPISLGNSDRNIPKTIDFEYNDIVYMISRITDPMCVAVIEIVASKFDTARNLVAAQFG
ncbi:hypothetical protein EON64_03290 [archaeon]|nr:MAG: hypothetical protein EON64_03290 [archaeon]